MSFNSNYTNKRKFGDPLALPDRWLNCPRKSDGFIDDKFIAFKVPLGKDFDERVPLENRFNMSMIFKYMEHHNSHLGFVIDLVNTDRYYKAKEELVDKGVRYYKLKLKGHGETPSEENTQLFIKIIDSHIAKYPLDKIGIHCTHGFNRTGFLICAYLVEKQDYCIETALSMFAAARPPGIYKQDYVNELFRRYADPSAIPPKTEYPDWESGNDAQNGSEAATLENSDGEDEADEASDAGVTSNGNGRKRPRVYKNSVKVKNPTFAKPDLEGITVCSDEEEIQRIQALAQEWTGWKGAGFPGAQPVSMDMQNVNNLARKPYMVSWKADGTRYLMLINGRDQVYMLDRDNSVFKVSNVSFLFSKELKQHLSNSLIDGEFVLDDDPKDPTKKVPRFLIYDVIRFEGEKIGDKTFQVRLDCITKEFINVRNNAISKGYINKEREPFSIRKKEFYQLIVDKKDSKGALISQENIVQKLLSPEFEKQITHGIDGLIFQPLIEPYKGGRCDDILKWKPHTMNSVDFKLVIKKITGQMGMLDETRGELWVNGYEMPFSTIKVTRKISGCDGKIIECRWLNESGGKWDFMRERTDKSYPNHVSTAKAVCESIKNPVTDEYLLKCVESLKKPSHPRP